MKKKIVTLIVAFTLAVNFIFANDGSSQVPASVKSEFSQTFNYPKEASWESFGSYFKVTFQQRNGTMYAFYSDDAELMGIAKNVLSDQLPYSLQAKVKDKFQGYWITSLVKFRIGDQDGYMVSLENADQKLVLKTGNSMDWHIYSRKVKSF